MTKVTLYRPDAVALAQYFVDVETIKVDVNSSGNASVGHHIVILDRSGSMYREIDNVKNMLIKLFTLDEYMNSELKITLISYSSFGDLTCHFKNVPISVVMDHDEPFLEKIKSIRATCLTCISQALELAESLIDDNEATAITLHSDGYANDRSVYSEKSRIFEICEKLSGRNVVLNTVAYTDWSDFQLLANAANSVSGSCLKANGVKEVYDSLCKTHESLSKDLVPPIDIPLGVNDFQVIVSEKTERINAASESVKFAGANAGDEIKVYRFKKQGYVDDTTGGVPSKEAAKALYIFAKSQLAMGNLNAAKNALYSTGDKGLFGAHSRALTSNQIAELSAALDKNIFRFDSQNRIIQDPSEKTTTSHTLIELISLIGENKSDLLLNLKALKENYIRRGLKRISGTRDENGNFIEFPYDSENTDDGQYVTISGVEFNNSSATINMTIRRPARLIERKTKKVVSEVAGISLNNMATFNQYTIFGDGEVRVKNMKVKISSKKAFDALKGILGLTDFNPGHEVEIDLTAYPVISFGGDFKIDSSTFMKLAKYKAKQSFLSALWKEDTKDLTAEQAEELAKYGISKSLYFNFPTTNTYADLDEAIKTGEVDSIVTYKVDIGNTDILNLSKLQSANTFVVRFYEMYNLETGETASSKFKLEDLADGKHWIRRKQVSARTKVTRADELWLEVADALVEDREACLSRELTRANLDHLNKQNETLFREKVIPLVFYIGSTGMVPEGVASTFQTADELQADFPELNIAKAETEGLFFRNDKNDVITVYPSSKYVTVEE